MCVCVCVCVCEREGERERKKSGKKRVVVRKTLNDSWHSFSSLCKTLGPKICPLYVRHAHGPTSPLPLLSDLQLFSPLLPLFYFARLMHFTTTSGMHYTRPFAKAFFVGGDRVIEPW